MNSKNAERSSKQSELDAEQPALDAEQPALDAEQPALDAEQPALDAGQSALDAEQSALDTEQLALDAEQLALDAEQSTQITKQKDGCNWLNHVSVVLSMASLMAVVFGAMVVYSHLNNLDQLSLFAPVIANSGVLVSLWVLFLLFLLLFFLPFYMPYLLAYVVKGTVKGDNAKEVHAFCLWEMGVVVVVVVCLYFGIPPLISILIFVCVTLVLIYHYFVKKISLCLIKDLLLDFVKKISLCLIKDLLLDFVKKISLRLIKDLLLDFVKKISLRLIKDLLLDFVKKISLCLINDRLLLFVIWVMCCFGLLVGLLLNIWFFLGLVPAESGDEIISAAIVHFFSLILLFIFFIGINIVGSNSVFFPKKSAPIWFLGLSVVIIFLIMLYLFVPYGQRVSANLLNQLGYIEKATEARWYLLDKRFVDQVLVQKKTDGQSATDEQSAIYAGLRDKFSYKGSDEKVCKIDKNVRDQYKNVLCGYMRWNLGDTKIFCPENIKFSFFSKDKADKDEANIQQCLIIKGEYLHLVPEFKLKPV